MRILYMFGRWFSRVKDASQAINKIFSPADSSEVFEATRQQADKDPLGFAIIPAGLVSNRVAIFTGADKPEVTDEQLKQIMDLDEPNSRTIFFKSIADITESSFFLYLQRKDAGKFRSDFIRFMEARHAKEISDELLEKLFVELRSGDLKQKDVREKITMYASTIVSKTMFGIEYTPKLEVLMSAIEDNAEATLKQGLSFRTSDSADSEREIRGNIDDYLKEYIQEALGILQKDKKRFMKPTNFLEQQLVRIINAHYQGWNGINRVDPDVLINDPELRTSISGLLAARNISHLFISALNHIYSICRSRTTDYRNKYVYGECERIFFTNDTNSKSMNDYPYLHAFYLECLRYYPPTSYIYRYTESGIKNDFMDIPSNTRIMFDIRSAMKKSFQETGHHFDIYHYLNVKPDNKGETSPKVDNGKAVLIADRIKRKQGPNLAFGAGFRACPAVFFVEVIFKNFIGKFIGNINRLEFNRFGESKAIVDFVDMNARKSDVKLLILEIERHQDRLTKIIDNSKRLISKLEGDETIGNVNMISLVRRIKYNHEWVENLEVRYKSLLVDMKSTDYVYNDQYRELQTIESGLFDSVRYLLKSTNTLVQEWRTFLSISSLKEALNDEKEFHDQLYACLNSRSSPDEVATLYDQLINRNKELIELVMTQFQSADKPSNLIKSSLFISKKDNKITKAEFDDRSEPKR